MFGIDDLGAFALILARTSGWAATVPIFGRSVSSATGRLGLALALAFFMSSVLPGAEAPDGLLAFSLVAAGQAIYGLVLGWLVGLVLTAFEVAGSAVDLFSGFSASSILDPNTGNQNAVMARMFSLFFSVALFVTNAHLVVIGAFLQSFRSTPPTQIPVLDEDGVVAVGDALAAMLLTALEIGAPLLGALLLAEVSLALAARFTPQANIFMLGLPVKALITFSMLGTVLVMLPFYAERLVEHAIVLGRVFG